MRERIVERLTEALQAVEGARAAWVGGSDAFGRDDAASDIDLVVVADRDAAEAVWAAVEARLEDLGGVAARWDLPPGSNPDYDQRFYLPTGAPETLMVDVCVLWPDRLAAYLDPDRHGLPRVLFDRDDLVRPRADETLADTFATRLDRLRARHALLAHVPGKNADRGHLVEAVDTYHRLLLVFLVELLRARWSPRRQDFGLRYLHVDLPEHVHGPLSELFVVRDLADLRAKIARARAWIDEELAIRYPPSIRRS